MFYYYSGPEPDRGISHDSSKNRRSFHFELPPTDPDLISKVAKGIVDRLHTDVHFKTSFEKRIEQLLKEGHDSGKQYVRKDHNVVHAVQGDFVR